MKELLEDAKMGGIERVRLYGGEPLLHPKLPDMIRHSLSLGLSTHVNTNGILLSQKIDQLYKAGLRGMTIGFYGTADAYDAYVQRSDRFARLENGIATLRRRDVHAAQFSINAAVLQPGVSGGCVAFRRTIRHELPRRFGALLSSVF